MGNLKGYYVIAIYGIQTSSYSLTVRESDKKIIEIFAGQP